MQNMSNYLRDLEAHEDLEAEVIKKTKIHKVLKAIIKLNSIPKEEEYSFKQRSNDLLTKWGGALAADNETPATESATNGVKATDEGKSEPAKEDSPAEKKEEPTVEVKEDDAPTEPTSANAADADGDVTMGDADKEPSKDELAVKPNVDASAEPPTAPATAVETAPASAEITTS